MKPEDDIQRQNVFSFHGNVLKGKEKISIYLLYKTEKYSSKHH